MTYLECQRCLSIHCVIICTQWNGSNNDEGRMLVYETQPENDITSKNENSPYHVQMAYKDNKR